MDAALEVGHGVFDWVLEASWQAAFLAVLVLGVQWLFRKRLTAEWRYGLWLLVILRLLIPAFPESAFSVYNLRDFAGVPDSQFHQGDERFNRPASTRSTEREQSISGTQKTELAVPDPSPGSADETPVAAKASSEPRRAADRSQEKGKPLLSTVSLYDVVMGLWLAGAIALALSVFIGNFRLVVLLRRNGRTVTTPQVLSSLKACGVRMGVRPPELVETDLVQSPAVYGLWRRRLLLPRHVVREFSPGELEYVFLHELAHLKRRDTWVDAAMVLSQVLHWFNPAVWLTVSRMRLERELACDRMALARSNEDERLGYGETMIKVLERFRRASSVSGVVGVLEVKSQLRRRIELIASYRPKRKWPILGGLVIVFLGAIALTDAESSRQTIQLEDGSKIAIAKVTSGTDQRFVYGSSWENFTYSVVPGYFLDTQQGDDEELTYRQFRDSHGRKAIFRPKESSVVLWIEHHGFDGSISSYPKQYEVVTIGPDGRPFSTAQVHPIDKLEGRAILAWELERFPRRGEKIECRLEAGRETEWEEMARFSVPNPERKDYPEWEPKPLPITKTRDGLTVKLTDVKTGIHPWYSHFGEDETPYETRVGVEVYVNGEPTTAWQPGSFSWSWVDATGNRHRKDWDGIYHDNVNNEQARIFPGLIGTSEPWKIRVGLRAGPGASFPEESLIRISNFRLSTNNTSVVTRKVGDVSLELRTDPNKEGSAPLRLERTPVKEEDQVTIVSAKNEAGETVPLTRKVNNSEKGLSWFESKEGELAMPQRLDLTVAVYRAPEFEFVAQPDWFSQKWTEPTKEDISELIDGLNSENRTTRWNAAEALKELGALAEEAVPALTKALDDSSPKVR